MLSYVVWGLHDMDGLHKYAIATIPTFLDIRNVHVYACISKKRRAVCKWKKDDDKTRYSTFKSQGSLVEFTDGIVSHGLVSKIQYTELD